MDRMEHVFGGPNCCCSWSLKFKLVLKELLESLVQNAVTRDGSSSTSDHWVFRSSIGLSFCVSISSNVELFGKCAVFPIHIPQSGHYTQRARSSCHGYPLSVTVSLISHFNLEVKAQLQCHIFKRTTQVKEAKAGRCAFSRSIYAAVHK